MTSYNPMPFVILREFDDSGELLALGTVETYEAGSSTPLATFSDSTGTPNTNPVVLDASGSASIFMQPKAYRLVFKDAAGNVVRTLDGINGSGSGADGATVATVSNYQALRDLAEDFDSIHVLGRVSIGDGGEGWFYQIAATADDDGIVLVRGTSTSYRRMMGTEINPRWYGLRYAVGTGQAQDSAIAQAQAASAVYGLPARYTGRLDIGNLSISSGTAIFDQGASVVSASASPVVLTFSGGFAPASLPPGFVGNAVRLRWAGCKEAFTSWWTTDGTFSACDKMLYLGAQGCRIMVDADFRADQTADAGTYFIHAGGVINVDENVVFSTLGLYAENVPWITFENSTALNSYIISADSVNPVWFYGDSASFWHACAASNVVEFPPRFAAQAGIWSLLPSEPNEITLRNGTVAGDVSFSYLRLDNMEMSKVNVSQTCFAKDSKLGSGSSIGILNAERCTLNVVSVIGSANLIDCNNEVSVLSSFSGVISGGNINISGHYNLTLNGCLSKFANREIKICGGVAIVNDSALSGDLFSVSNCSFTWNSSNAKLNASGCTVNALKSIALDRFFSTNNVTGLSPHAGVTIIPTRSISVTGCTFDNLPIKQPDIPDGMFVSFRGCISPILGMGWRRINPIGIQNDTPKIPIMAICKSDDGNILACRNSATDAANLTVDKFRSSGFRQDNINTIAYDFAKSIASGGGYVAIEEGDNTANLYSGGGAVFVKELGDTRRALFFYGGYWYSIYFGFSQGNAIFQIERTSDISSDSWSVYSPFLFAAGSVSVLECSQLFADSSGDVFFALPFRSEDIGFFDSSENTISYPGIFGNYESSDATIKSTGITGANGVITHILARKCADYADFENELNEKNKYRSNDCLVFLSDGKNAANTFVVGGIPSTNHGQIVNLGSALVAIGSDGELLVSDGACDVTFYGSGPLAVSVVEG